MIKTQQTDDATIEFEGFGDRNKRLRAVAAKLYRQCSDEKLTVRELKMITNLLLRQAENTHL